jgi:hypothetical protein
MVAKAFSGALEVILEVILEVGVTQPSQQGVDVVMSRTQGGGQLIKRCCAQMREFDVIGLMRRRRHGNNTMNLHTISCQAYNLRRRYLRKFISREAR